MQETLYFGKTFDEIFEKEFKLFTRGREDHEFNHYNSSLGMWIYSKEHLKHEMKKRKILPFEVCEGLAEEWERKNDPQLIKEFSPKADSIIRSLKMSADKNGNLRLGDRAINALIEIGAITKRIDISDFSMQGGFNDKQLN